MIEEIFNLIPQLQNVKKQELFLSEDDKYIISQMYKPIKKYIYLGSYEKGVKVLQIETGNYNMFEVCDLLNEKIIQKYGKR